MRSAECRRQRERRRRGGKKKRRTQGDARDYKPLEWRINDDDRRAETRRCCDAQRSIDDKNRERNRGA